MNSNTGNSQTYVDGDQRTSKQQRVPDRFESGPPNAHDIHDPKDTRSLGNRAAQETKEERQEEQNRLHKTDPTAPAKAHGNKPSRGAEIDAELERDDELRLKEKGLA